MQGIQQFEGRQAFPHFDSLWKIIDEPEIFETLMLRGTSNQHPFHVFDVITKA
jgi:hypothetical protein